MKRFLISAITALILGSAPALAEDSTGANNDFYVEDDPVLLNPNTNQGNLRLRLNNETDNFNGFQFDLYLPTGFFIPTNNRGVFRITLNKGNDDDDKMYDQNVSAGYRDDANPPFYRVMVSSLTNSPILTGDDWLVNVLIQCPEGWCTPPPQHAKAEINNIIFSEGFNPAIQHDMSDLEFDITPNPGIVGVEDVEADAAGKDVIYDIHGRRVEGSLAPGVYIINGEKVRR